MIRRLFVLTLALSLVSAPTSAFSSQAPTTFKKLDFYVQEGDEMNDHDAQLILDARRRSFIFAEEDNEHRVFATVSWDRVTGVSYENSKHARITAAILVAWPMMFLSGKKHWLTITYGPDATGTPGGYVFARMDKDNFQTILAAINGYTGFEIRRIGDDGEISILYPGTQGAPAPAPAPAPENETPAQIPAAASPAPASGSAVAAGSLPPRNDGIPAGPLPPVAAPLLKPLTLLNKGVQWTDRTATAVGYVWAAEVQNDNEVEIDSTVFLRLFDPQGSVIHEAMQRVTVGAGQMAAFTAEGEVPEAVAVRADHWEFHVALPTDPGSNAVDTPPAATPGRASLSRAAYAPAAPMMEPVPLTDDMVKPVLDPASVTIVTDSPVLQQINLDGSRITIRCLIGPDGRVADARVFRIAPEITSEATDADLKAAIRDSAIRHWRFSPALKNGASVPVWHMVTVEYRTGRDR